MFSIAFLISVPLTFGNGNPVDMAFAAVCEGSGEACDPAGVSLLQKSAKLVEKANLTAKSVLDNNAHAYQDKAQNTRKSRRSGRAGMAPVFFDVETMDSYQLLVCTIVYGYVLYVGSNMLGDGSEALGFFSSVRGIVGSVVVPILGAVPDSMMVLMSGLGADAQTQVTTGVGALAGSTVMLLTFPWFIVNMAGSVPMKEDGTADYSRSDEAEGLFSSAVTYGPSVGTNAKIMVLTSLSFLIIQIPAWFVDHSGVPLAEQAASENSWAGIGLVVSLVFFVGYIAYMYCTSDGSDLQKKVIADGIISGDLTLAGAIAANQDHKEELLKSMVPAFFKKYDDDGNKTIDVVEFSHVLRDLGEPVKNNEDLNAEFKKASSSGSPHDLSLSEFQKYIDDYMSNKCKMLATKTYASKIGSDRKDSKYKLKSDDDDDDDEVELPPELQDKTPEEQARGMLANACWNMGVGTILVCLFADPAVDVFDEWGVKWGISSFYVGFLLAPFASNASELLVAYGMALKKTSKSVTCSLESLIGAACMNNTLCLAVFFALIYFRNLAWKFKAETLGIMVIQWIMALIVLSSNTQRKAFGFVILALYPLCLLIVWFCENELGWD
jgi:Ca2+/Na+ antiporter